MIQLTTTIMVHNTVLINPIAINIHDEELENVWKFYTDKNSVVIDLGLLTLEEFVLLNNTENSFVLDNTKEFKWYNPLTWF